MSDFTIVKKALVSGVSSFQFLPVAHIDNFPFIIGSTINEFELTLIEGKQWQQGTGLVGSMEYTELPANTINGIKYKKELTGFLPHDDVGNVQLFESLYYVPLIIKYRDHDGDSRIFGTPDEPVRILPVEFTTDTLGGKKGFTYTFAATHNTTSPIVIRPTIPQFSIVNGILIYQGGLAETFSVNGNGELIVTGDREDQYSIQGGNIFFDLD